MASNTGKRARKASPEDGFSVHSFSELSPLNWAQETYMEAIQTNDIVFGIGSAGTGKTYIAAHWAAKQLYYKRVDKVILTRPNIEVGASLGFLPGTLEEKYLPYLEPFQSAFSHFLGKGFYEYALKNGNIDPRPLAYMRGSTFNNAIVLVDECQNMTSSEFKMLLSRIGKNCKIILSGDPSQYDIRSSGLDDAVRRLEHVDGVEVVRFLDSDIVRSKLCKQIILAYNK